jgi:hypothetical protein
MRVIHPPICMNCEKIGHTQNECAYINGNSPDEERLLSNDNWVNAYEFIRIDFGTFLGYSGRSATGSRCILCKLFGHQKRTCAYHPNNWVNGTPSQERKEEQSRITRIRILNQDLDTELVMNISGSTTMITVNHKIIHNLHHQVHVYLNQSNT